ncbi:hypothetical protein H0O00_04835 [Candidatus Micrarchaeota archaeon]|nr:hypothetical protein [Candidatus Micrarchaeota archaeon]
MSVKAGVRQPVAASPALAMANRFGRYKPETEQTVRKVEVVENETLKKMKTVWKTRRYNYSITNGYGEMLESIKNRRYSAKDIENFNLALVEFQNGLRFSEKAGQFLSALINSSKDSEFVIHTYHLARLVHHLGCRNTKNIAVKGDIGRWAGNTMDGGALIVEGDAGSFVGQMMKGGTITVGGDVGSQLGNGMHGGSITVRGNSGELVGFLMRGGEIHIEGDYVSIADNIIHGKIFHKGKLIVDK